MLRVFEAFAGYGSQSLALERLGIEHEVVAISEIDKYAVVAYEAIHGKVLNLGDIKKINEYEVPEHDLFTYSFPCQDISVAGKMAGIMEIAGKRQMNNLKNHKIKSMDIRTNKIKHVYDNIDTAIADSGSGEAILKAILTGNAFKNRNKYFKEHMVCFNAMMARKEQLKRELKVGDKVNIRNNGKGEVVKCYEHFVNVRFDKTFGSYVESFYYSDVIEIKKK